MNNAWTHTHTHTHTLTQIICFSQIWIKWHTQTKWNAAHQERLKQHYQTLIGCLQAKATDKLRLLDSAHEKLCNVNTNNLHVVYEAFV